MSEELPPDSEKPQKLAPGWRTLIEVGIIIFLCFSGLLMREFERSGQGQGRGLWWAVQDIFTGFNFTIAIATGLVGYLGFEFLRKR